MAMGNWSLLHETSIYQYMMERMKEKRLKLLQVSYNGKFKSKKVNVLELDEITNTKFPDIDGIKIKDDKKGKRVAEVKFLTSQFDYHRQKRKNNKKDYTYFVQHKGCIIVCKHDCIPHDLDIDEIDIYQLETQDYITFIKENFDRLLYQQIRNHHQLNTWFFYTGRNSNYFKTYDKDLLRIPSAKESHIWGSKKYISPNELTVDDKVIFIKTGGCGQKELQRDYLGMINQWIIHSLVICKVVTPIMSRVEYCRKNNIQETEYLWASEAKNKKIEYNFIFEFEPIYSIDNIDCPINLIRDKIPSFIDNVLKEIFLRSSSKSVSQEDYVTFLELITNFDNKKYSKRV